MTINHEDSSSNSRGKISNGVQGYVHPPHRSLHGPLLVLAVFSIFLASWSLFSSNVQAVQMQADQACPAGGVVGQKCVDHTNGYATQGHCTHIMICAADSWPKAPRGCQPGMVVGRDCPYGKNYVPGPAPMPHPISISTSTFNDTPPSTISATDIFGKAFGTDSGDTGYAPSEEQSVVGTTSIGGIQYLITNDNEQLQVGEPLSPAPQPPPRLELNLGSVYNLGSSGQMQQTTSGGIRNTQGYTGSNSFSGPPGGGGSLGGTFSDNVNAAGSSIIGGIMNTIAMLFGGSGPADQLVVISAMPAIIMPDISLYHQAESLSSPQILDLGWDSLGYTSGDTFGSSPSITSLLRDALSHTGRIGLDLLTADLGAAHDDMTKALIASGGVIQRAGASLSAYFWGALSSR